jgi:hypothetical protein
MSAVGVVLEHVREEHVASLKNDVLGPAFEELLNGLETAGEALLEEERQQGGRRLWAAMMLALDLGTCGSVVRGGR